MCGSGVYRTELLVNINEWGEIRKEVFHEKYEV
jgi:hypothetical protein